MSVNIEDLERINARLRDIESNLRRVLLQLDMEWQEPTPTEGIPDQVIELVRAGDKIGAVKTYRELTGSSLGEANTIVDGIVL
jgi:hypothetical protein